ncbi:MAG: hypothetical protein AAF488_05860 [Planctomycetota bacterium]
MLRLLLISALALCLPGCVREIQTNTHPLLPGATSTVQGTLGSYFFRFEQTSDLGLRRTPRGGVEVYGREIRPVVAKPQNDAEREQPRWEFHANGRFYRFRRFDRLRDRKPGQRTRYRVTRPTIYVFRPQPVHEIDTGGLSISWNNERRHLLFLEPMPESDRWHIGEAVVERFSDGSVRFQVGEEPAENLSVPASFELDSTGRRVGVEAGSGS